MLDAENMASRTTGTSAFMGLVVSQGKERQQSNSEFMCVLNGMQKYMKSHAKITDRI